MAVPHGPHGDDGSARDLAAESERQLRSAELEAAVEDLRASSPRAHSAGQPIIASRKKALSGPVQPLL